MLPKYLQGEILRERGYVTYITSKDFILFHSLHQNSSSMSMQMYATR